MKSEVLKKLRRLIRTGKSISELYPHELDILLIEHTGKNEIRDEVRSILNDMHYLQTQDINSTIFFQGPVFRYVAQVCD